MVAGEGLRGIERGAWLCISINLCVCVCVCILFVYYFDVSDVAKVVPLAPTETTDDVVVITLNTAVGADLYYVDLFDRTHYRHAGEPHPAIDPIVLQEVAGEIWLCGGCVAHLLKMVDVSLTFRL